MCVPGCREAVESALSRRALLGTAGVVGITLAAGAGFSGLRAAQPQDAGGARREAPGGEGGARGGSRARPDGEGPSERRAFPAFSAVVDLTHTYSSRFPHFRGDGSRVDLETVHSTERGDGWNVKLWTLDEHAGTHVDAPVHRAAGGLSVDRIPAADLVLPLAVIDIRYKARRSPDALLTPDDLLAWEAVNGPLPPRVCVALWSGWEARIATAAFLGIDEQGTRHFPGFHIDAIDLLLEERQAAALATDTPSFDPGDSTDFPAHTRWLGAGRWALENAAALGEVPAAGATIVCGAPKVAGATGGPSRAFALI